MIDKIKIFYRNNTIWMYLAKYIIISLFLAIGVILIDSKFIGVLEIIPDVFLTSVELAKLILSTLAGALLTITTFTFSTIMVVLTMYSSNFSPRVVNNFLTDKMTMKVLGVFIGGFFYCILALFFMRNSFSEYSVLSATIAVVYSALCVIYFVIFVYRVSSSIQATKLISRLYDESYTIIEKALDNRKNQTSTDRLEVGIFSSKFEIISDKSGYLELINYESLLDKLKDEDTKLVIREDMGSFIAKGQILGSLYYNEEDKKDDDKNESDTNNDELTDKKDKAIDKYHEELTEKILGEITIQEERMAYNDYRFSLQKIIDITLRAISPGINDPNTAIHCINILSVLLSRLSEIDGRFTVMRDEKSKSEIVHEDFHFKEDLYFVFYQIIHYGKEDMSIVVAIFNALKTIKRASSDEKKATLEEFSDYLYDKSRVCFKHELDLEFLKRARNAV